MNSLAFVFAALKTNLRLSVEFRYSVLINIIVAVIKQSLFLIAWYFFFDKYQLVQGWNFKDLLLMYGLVAIGVGVVEVFFYGARELPRIIEYGLLDVYLVQPKNVILNIALSRGKISSLGDIVVGVLAILFSGYACSAPASVIAISFLSPLFIFSVHVYLASLSFFMANSSEFIKELYSNVIVFATQPNSAYTGWLKLISMTVIPISFLSFFPIEFVKNNNRTFFVVAYCGTIAFFVIACWIFSRALKRYESGFMIGNKI